MTNHSEISNEKNSLLQRWLTRNKEQKADSSIPRLPMGMLAPLSFSQQRLWFLQQIFPDNPFYHYADIFRIKGRLDQAHYVEAIRLVAQNHDVLRTTFQVKDGRTVQVVNPGPGFEISIFDLSHLPKEKREKEAEKMALSEARKPFDLLHGPLTRIALIRLSENEHFQLLAMHHIITDKWSMKVLLDEWAMTYNALCAGENIKLTPPPIQYGDYAHWHISQKTNLEHLNYWKNKLANGLSILNLPYDHPRPVRPSFQGSLNKQQFPLSISKKLKTISKEANTTMFVVMLAAFKALLYRYSGQGDILIGTPVTNRDQSEWEKLIGFFNDTLVLRSSLTDGLSFLELVQQIRQTSLDAFSHKNTPFDSIVKALKPERYMSANPLFQIMFLYDHVTELPSFGPEISLQHEPFDFGVAKFDLTLYIAEDGEQLTSIFEYAKDLFEEETIHRMQSHLATLLRSIVENPNQLISRIPILPTTEKQQILEEWNDTEKEIAAVECIHHLIEKKAKETPEKIAALQNLGGNLKLHPKLTFKELNDRADSVAMHLHQIGIKENTPIGLCTERSLDMIVGILGILKAGLAYLPLDPDYPSERVEFMVNDAAVPIILSQKKLIDLLPKTNAHILDIKEIYEHPKNDLVRPSFEPNKNSIAYIIYTSGSTGQPKGVAVTHANLVHSTLARFDFYEEQPRCFLLLSSFAFDSSVAGIFWTLCSGGTLLLPEKRIEQDVQELATIIFENKVTHTLLLPSLYSVVLQHAPAEMLASLNTVVVAGEACPVAVCKNHFKKLPTVSIYNEYGPTEATVWCIAHKIIPKDIAGNIPIGKPISNTEVYILGKNLEPVPVGVAGELYIGGAGVTKGYWKRAEITASHFIENPFVKKNDSKLYKTGDLAKYRPDGIIEFLGRADHQVKIRGFRIELDEIKEIIQQFSGVKEAVVVVQKEDKGPQVNLPEEPAGLLHILEKMDKEEAERILSSIESLSENELDYMLNVMGKNTMA